MKEFKKVELPFFGGFYESEYYYSDSIYNEIYGDDSYFETYGSDDPNDYDIDFESYKNDVCESYCESFKDHAPAFVESVNLAEITSPKYYNYSTDKVFADIVLADNWREEILSFMESNKEWLSDRISEEWTSRDGFWSFMDNDFNDWLERFKNEEELDDRYLSTMLGYMMLIEGGYDSTDKLRWSLAYNVLDNVYIGSYIKYIGEEKESV